MIVYITSFNHELYEATGKKLLRSFRKLNKNDLFYVGHEEFLPSESKDDLILDEISKDSLLKKFLRDNKKVIPDYLGGIATHCECKDWENRHSPHHKAGCHYHWMNRNMYRWFRKVITIKRAIEKFPEHKMIWLDSDCKLLKMMGDTTFRNLCHDKAIWMFKGWRREAPEVGIIGWDFTKHAAKKVFDNWLLRYTSGAFKHDHRWDDGYQFGVVAKDAYCNDLARKKHLLFLKTNHIIPRTVIRKYIRHDKGMHGRILGIMK